MVMIAVLGLVVLCTTVALAAQVQPNILMIVADDFGYNDVGYHQSTPTAPKPHPANPLGEATTDAAAGVMPTPTLDQLASEGTKLEMYYVQPLCSPTRATFMTGRYPFHTGLGPDVICTSCGDPYGLPAREILMPALLREAGYTTAAIGKCVQCTIWLRHASSLVYQLVFFSRKRVFSTVFFFYLTGCVVRRWHLGDCDERYLPTFRGFDHFLGYMAGAQSYYHHAGDFRNGSAGDGLPPCVGESVANNYSTLLYASEAARIVRWHAQTSSAESRNDGPIDAANSLFLYLAFQSVHNPYDVPPPSLIDVNVSFPNIVQYSRRIYAGSKLL